MNWKGGSVFLYFLGNHGGRPSKNVGDVQWTSNIETTVESAKLFEAWVQQLFYEDRLSVLLGLHDLNSEFYVTDSSGMFLNSSFGIGTEFAQTGVNSPSIFPFSSPALRIRAEPSKAFYLQWGAFNAQAGDPQNPKGTHIRLNGQDGLLLVSEVAYLRGKEDPSQLAGKYGIGYWTYTKTFTHQTETISTDPANPTATAPVNVTSKGAYFLIDQSFSDQFSIFCRYGLASSESNQVKDNLAAGVLITGLIPFRGKDRLGIGFSHVEFGDEYRKSQETLGSFIKGAETAYEFTYRIELIPGVAFQPNLQYVRYPSGNEITNHSTVLVLRTELTF